MKKQKTTTAILLETRTPKKDGMFPAKLRVTYDRKQRYYTTGKSFTVGDYDRMQGDKPRGELKEAKIFLNSFEEKAINIIESLPVFTFQAFDKEFYSDRKDRSNVWTAFEEAIARLDSEGRAGTANSYQCSYNSLRTFKPKSFLAYADITVDYLKAYEKWMLNEGNSLTSVGIYLRNLRTLFNDAITAGIVKQEFYPFHKRGYQIPSGRNVKKALTLEDIEKVYRYSAIEGTKEQFSKDLWMFSYLCNGMNFKDIALLKYKNVDADRLTFVRAKTERTKRNDTKPIIVILSSDSKEIIEKWGNKPETPDAYIFPVLQPGQTPKEQRAKVLQFIKTANKYIARIATSLGIDKHVTTYTARHSFSTVLKRSGAPIEFISESLGHRDLKTTEGYLDSFEDDVKKQWANKLTEFKKREPATVNN